MKMKSKVQNTNISGIKRKAVLESEAKLSNVSKPSRKNNATLKEDLVIELKELKEKYIVSEEKSKNDMTMLETENKNSRK